MTDLRSRILSGSGPDRELDALVWCTLHPGSTAIIDGTHIRAGCDVSVKQGDGEWFRPPPLTACPEGVGHCLALMDEALPDWVIYSTTNCDVYDPWRVERADKYSVELKGTKPMTGSPYAQGEHEELPRALLAALTDAKAQEAG